jgi:acylglycerol lipase
MMPSVVQLPPEILWLKASDGLTLACRHWKGKPGYPVVAYIHGIEGHSQWFENTASLLNAQGMTVFAFDRRGAGLNPRDRGNLSSYKLLLADLETFLRKISFDYVGHSLVLIGNCWGAKLASVLCQKDYRPVSSDAITLPIAGLVLISPGIFTKVDYGLSTKLQIAYNSIIGEQGRQRKWPIPLELSMFTDNPSFHGYLGRDPLRLTEATANFFVESFKLSKLAEVAAPQLQLPLLMLQAGADRIVDLEKTQAFFSKIKSSSKEMRIFPDASHCLDFDQTWFKEYVHVLSAWIMAQCPVVR